MPARLLECPRCGEALVVDTSMQSVVCERCGTWLHATTCVRCEQPFVAIGGGAQVCPGCGTHQHLEAVGTFDDVDGPIVASLSRVPIRTVERPPGDAPRRGARYDDFDRTPRVLAGVLWAGAALVALAGFVLAIGVGRAVADVHGGVLRGVLAVGGVVVSTTISVAVLAALAFLVERVAGLERRVDALRAREREPDPLP